MKQPLFFFSPDGDAGGDPKTDNTKLVGGTVFVSPDGGTTNEAFPKQGVEYDFCIDVTNTGTLSSGPFFVRFTLSGDQNPPFTQDFQQDAGLDAGASVRAVVHFGSFPNEFKDYFLEACIYSPSAPEKPIACGGTFDFAVNTESTNSSASGSSDSSSPDNSAPSSPDDSGQASNGDTGTGSADNSGSASGDDSGSNSDSNN